MDHRCSVWSLPVLDYQVGQSMSVLRKEISRLNHVIERTEQEMINLEEDFWQNGGICCPGCGVPGFSEMEEKQERRKKQLRYLIKKYEKDSGRKYEDHPEARSLASRIFNFLLGLDPD